MNQGMKQFAPETAVGTGAAEPVVDEYEAAKEVPSVDESTLEGGRSNNQPQGSRTVEYSGDKVADDASDERSTGEDYETRNKDNDEVPLAGAAVPDDDSEVNAKAEDVRPEVPQETKRSRKAKSEL